VKNALLVAAWLALGAASDEPLQLVDLEGRRVALGPPAAGETIVVHFWTTWCPSCEEELAILDRAATRCAGSPARVAAVNVGEDAAGVRDWLARRDLRLPMLRDEDGRAWRSVRARGLPANVVWRGDERRLEVGPRDERSWSEALSAIGCAPP
jgi:thiol-disulfide isomerase/thioredoxin